MTESPEVERNYWKKGFFGGKGKLKSEYQLLNGKRNGKGTLYWE